MRDPAIFLALLAVLALASRCVTNGVLLWAWAAALDLNHQFYGFLGTLPYQKVFALTTICMFFFGRERKHVYFDRSLILMLAFLALGLISQAGALTSQQGGWEILDKLGKMVLLAHIISWTLWRRVQIHALVIAICLGLGVTAVWEGTLFFVSGASHRVEGSASLGDNNEVALLVAMIIPLAYYIFTVSTQPLVRLASMGACILFVACVFATQSRGGFIALLTLAAAAAVFSKRKIAAISMAAVLALGFALVMPHSWTERMHTIDAADQDSSFMGRVVAWKMSTLIALDHPFFGGGFHAVQHQDVWDHYTPSFGDLGFVPTEPPDVHAHAAHSLYFEVLGDTGFLGLAVMLLIVASAFGNARAIKRLSRSRDDLHWAYGLAGNIQLSLLIFMISGAALSTAYMELNYLLFAILSVLRRQLEAAAEEAREPPRGDGLLAVSTARDGRPPWRIGRGTAPAGALVSAPWRAGR